MHPSAHVDTFARDNLPPFDAWPDFIFSLPELDYPAQQNCVDPLLDKHVREGRGDKVAVRSLDESWTYAEFQGRVNRIANVLHNDVGIVPGNCVLLRFPNSPFFAACYLAVLKMGAVAVPTMPLLRSTELKTIADKAKIRFSICDSRLGLSVDL